jgi:hypothetical protein
MHVTCIFCCYYYNQPMHNYISQQCLFIQYIPLHVSTFPYHHQSVLHFHFVKLHKLLQLKLLKLQFHKIIKMYY